MILYIFWILRDYACLILCDDAWLENARASLHQRGATSSYRLKIQLWIFSQRIFLSGVFLKIRGIC
jgi:hypothetical protein